MTIEYRILPELELVLVRFIGEIGAEEHISSFLDYAADPLFDGRQDVLMDMSQATFNESHFEGMQSLAYRLKGYYAVRDRASRTAVWAPGDVTFGMCRMYQSIAEASGSWSIGVFRTREEAVAHLGLEEGAPGRLSLLTAWDAARAS